MKTGTILAAAVAALAIAAGVYMIDVDQTEETVTVPSIDITTPEVEEVASN